MNLPPAAEKRSPLRPTRLCCALLACQLAFTHASLSQTPSATTPPQEASAKRTFDVVSIRRSTDTDRMRGFGVSENEYFSMNWPLGMTVLRAYLPMAFARQENLLNAPAWLWNDTYDFVGKMTPADAAEIKAGQRNWASANPVLESMLQNALKERCGLVAHRVTVERDGYALVQSKHPGHLQPATGTETIPKHAVKISDGGYLVPYQRGDEPKATYYAVSMTGFATNLTLFVGRPVEDHTGLSGNFDFIVPIHQEAEDPTEKFEISSLGLELKPIKIKVEAVSIDHIDKPTPN